MSAANSYQSVNGTLIRWAGIQENVRALILTSSRVNPQSFVDSFSDYDVILVAKDIQQFLDNETWLWDFGQVLVVYRDPVRLDYGCKKFARITQYENGLKIDFTVWPVELLEKITNEPRLPGYLDDGYQVLLDKTDLTKRLKPPSYSVYIPVQPTAKTYRESVEEFFSESCYVAKQICREDLFPLKYNLDHVMKFKKLRQMLEWKIEIENNWSLKMGSYGKTLKKQIKPDMWKSTKFWNRWFNIFDFCGVCFALKIYGFHSTF
jgi:aminoglycoside 6-adenylyltransferase